MPSKTRNAPPLRLKRLLLILLIRVFVILIERLIVTIENAICILVRIHFILLSLILRVAPARLIQRFGIIRPNTDSAPANPQGTKFK